MSGLDHVVSLNNIFYATTTHVIFLQSQINPTFEIDRNLMCISSGGSRISPRGCANSQNCYYFSNFCQKLQENESPRGARVPGAPLRSTNDIL